jgi:hypothetical protein
MWSQKVLCGGVSAGGTRLDPRVVNVLKDDSSAERTLQLPLILNVFATVRDPLALH